MSSQRNLLKKQQQEKVIQPVVKVNQLFTESDDTKYHKQW